MNMFHEVRLPENVAFGIKGGPCYLTDIINDQSGAEYRNIRKSYPLSKYRVSFKLQNDKQIEELITFFRERRGRAYGFRFKDYFDYKANNQVIAIGDGIKKKFQLVKHYGKEVRVIRKPILSTIEIFVDNIAVSAEFNDKNGEVILKDVPKVNSIIRANFEFDVPVRFDTDSFNAVMQEKNNYAWNDVDLIEIKI